MHMTKFVINIFTFPKTSYIIKIINKPSHLFLCTNSTVKGLIKVGTMVESKRSLVQSYILDMIKSQKLNQGDRLPTEKQLCDQFAVSRITVQNALEELRKDGWIYRIQGGGTFVGNNPAGDNAQTSLPFIPFIISDNNPTTRCLEIINGAEDYLKTKSCYVTVHSPNGDLSKENEIIQSLIDKGIKSMIILPFQSDINNCFYFNLIRQNINLVFVDLIPNGLTGNLVCSNNVLGGYLITEHLIQQGYRRIGVVSGSVISAPSAKDRITGYRFALESAGLPVDEKYIRIESTVNTRKDLNEAIPRILDYFFSLPDPPDALFGVNDLTAVDLYNALNNRGIHVPTDIALSGFDNLAASIDNPIPITTVEQNYYDIGYNAAKICYESSDFNKQMFTHCILPVKLIKRQSTFKKQF